KDRNSSGRRTADGRMATTTLPVVCAVVAVRRCTWKKNRERGTSERRHRGFISSREANDPSARGESKPVATNGNDTSIPAWRNRQPDVLLQGRDAEAARWCGL